MAVYKPTNCTPYLTAIDVTQTPQFLECRVDSSNSNVTAYSIVIYDEDNTQVFPVNSNGEPADRRISPISELRNYVQSAEGYSYLNSGYNGTYLRIPFLLSMTGQDYLSNNCLYVANDGAVQDVNGTSIAMSNGYSYKWVITLYQGTTTDSSGEVIAPSRIQDFDMVLTSGVVLGSNIERIQSRYSENIFVDYYIQPVRIENLIVNTDGTWRHPLSSGEAGNTSITQVGTRVRIKNYDSTYGYIYPQTGDSGFAQGIIDAQNVATRAGVANGFYIYTMTNNPDDVTAQRLVNFYSPTGVPWKWTEMLNSASNSYATQIYYIPNDGSNVAETLVTAAEGGLFYPFDIVYASTTIDSDSANNYVSNLSQRGRGVSVNDRIALGKQADNADYYSSNNPGAGNPPPSFTGGSPYNGIFYVTSSQIEAPEEGTGGYYKVTLTWMRASGADTWGSLINSIVVVSDTSSIAGEFSGQNIQIERTDVEGEAVASTMGSLNETPVRWVEEKPVELYDYTGSALNLNPDINTVGLIYYNEALDPTVEGSVGKMYIRPFVGLEAGMWWQQSGAINSSVYHFIIDEVDTANWCITYSNLYTGQSNAEANRVNTAVWFPSDNSVRYQIRSYFRTGDENVFYLEAAPELTVSFYPTEADADAGTNFFPVDLGLVNVNSRSIYCLGNYFQTNNIHWRSFSWELYDTRGDLVQQSGTQYDGKLGFLIRGLITGENYIVRLTMEDNYGTIVTAQYTLSVDYATIDLSIPFDLVYDCETQSVEVNLTSTGYVLPNEPVEGTEDTLRVMNSDGTDTVPPISGVTYDGSNMIIDSSVGVGGVYYSQFSSSTNNSMSLFPITIKSNEFTIQSCHHITNENFQGEILRFEISDVDVLGSARFSIEVPSTLLSNGMPNTARNTLEWYFYDGNNTLLQSGSATAFIQGIVIGNPNEFVTGVYNSSYAALWRKKRLLPTWQLAGFNPSGSGGYYVDTVGLTLSGTSNAEYSNAFTILEGPLNDVSADLTESTIRFPMDTLGDSTTGFRADSHWSNFEILTSESGTTRDVFTTSDGQTFQVYGPAPILWTDCATSVQDIATQVSNGSSEENYTITEHYCFGVQDTSSPNYWDETEDSCWRDGTDVSGVDAQGNNVYWETSLSKLERYDTSSQGKESTFFSLTDYDIVFNIAASGLNGLNPVIEVCAFLIERD